MSRKRVTTGLIEQYLDRHGWQKHRTLDEPLEQEGIVHTGWSSSLSPEGHTLTIDPLVEQHGLLFTVTGIAYAPTDATPADRLSGLLLAIAAINTRSMLGAFAYDPADGELAFRLGLPVDSDDLRYEDFEHCLANITLIVDTHAAGLRGIIDGTLTANDVIG